MHNTCKFELFVSWTCEHARISCTKTIPKLRNDKTREMQVDLQNFFFLKWPYVLNKDSDK